MNSRSNVGAFHKKVYLVNDDYTPNAKFVLPGSVG